MTVIDYYSKKLCKFFFVLLFPTGVWLMFIGLLAVFFSLFSIISVFDRFLNKDKLITFFVSQS